MKISCFYLGVKQTDGSVNYIYCHTSSNLLTTGKVLFLYYNTFEKANRLISRGTILSIDHNGNKEEFELNINRNIEYLTLPSKIYNTTLANFCSYTFESGSEKYLFDGKYFRNDVEVTQELINNEYEKLVNKM